MIDPNRSKMWAMIIISNLCEREDAASAFHPDRQPLRTKLDIPLVHETSGSSL
jgi:hypothetical protein